VLPSFLGKAIGHGILILALCAAGVAASGQTSTSLPLPVPLNGLVKASDGNFYSSTEFTGNNSPCSSPSSCGSLYRITPTGTVTDLHDFAVTDTLVLGGTPQPLIEGPDGNLYGTAVYGGTGICYWGYSCGLFFQLTPSGVFTIVHNFVATDFTKDPSDTDGSGQGFGPLLLGSDGNFYGFMSGGGRGALYKISPTGVAAPIFNFNSDPPSLGVNGFIPSGLIESSDGNFYGTTLIGYGATQNGTIFKLTPAGVLTTLATFPADNSLGVAPNGNLVEGPDGALYGVTRGGGTTVPATIYKYTPGGGIQTLYSFTQSASGEYLTGGLTMGSDGMLYGTAQFGGASNLCYDGCGTVFRIGLDGSGFQLVRSFTGGIDGGSPYGPVIINNDGNIDGTNGAAVSVGTGTLFEISDNLPAPIQISFTQNGKAVTATGTGMPVTLNWSVLNAFSISAQQCYAFIQNPSTGGGTWSGKQVGTLSGNAYSGSTTITPTIGGEYTYALTCGGVESGFGTLTVASELSIAATLANAQVGKAYSQDLTVLGGVQPYTVTVTSGSLPPGIALNAANGLLTGTPTQFGTYSGTVQVVDSATPQGKASAPFTLVVNSGLQITTTAIAKGSVGTAFTQTLAATGGTSPYTWSLTSGTLPQGIQLNASTGVLSGTPKDVESQTVTLQVTDSEGKPATTSATFQFVVVPPPPIAAIEFTQAIQQYQVLDDLKTSLKKTGEPLVPIVAGKPAVMRIYYSPVTTLTHYSLSITTPISTTRYFAALPNCQPADQRARNGICYSQDIYFTPPAGSWTVALEVDDSSGNQLETETLTVNSRSTESINLKSVKVCDLNTYNGSVRCGDPSVVAQSTSYLSSVMPTNSVTVQATSNVVKDNSYNYPQPYAFLKWGLAVVKKIDAFYGTADQITDANANQRTTYMGIYDHQFDDFGIAEIAGHGAMVANLTERLGQFTEGSTMAHETGHTFGLLHTNLPGPQTQTAPGCYGNAEQPGTYWPYKTDLVQSAAGPEIGFDVPNQVITMPTSTYDIMAYCLPPWISPIQYKRAMIALGGGAVTTPNARGEADAAQSYSEPQPSKAASARPATTPALTEGTYLQIGGLISSGAATLNPIFTQTMLGSTDPGSGTYSIVLESSSGQALYTRSFTPLQLEGDGSDGTTVEGGMDFSEWVPQTAGAASVTILDDTGATIGSTQLGGTAPTVTITAPTAGFVGTTQQTVSWTITNSTAPAFSSRVYYSADNGATWIQAGESPTTSDTIDFSTLPGSSAALIRVDVSDGINTGSATSVPFSVPKHTPSMAVINTPVSGAVQPSFNPVYLSGAVYDADDGMLSGKQLQWTSNLAGSLGTGSPLSVTLQPGTHTITLTGTDSDGNSTTATTTITIAGAGPVVNVTSTQDSAGCPVAVIAANPGAQGADLTLVEYSLDNGMTYTPIPLGSIPFSLPVTGSGTVSLVAAAVDASGQIAAQSVNFTLTGCAPAQLTAAAGNNQSATVNTAFSAPLKIQVQNSNGVPLPGVQVTFAAPASGASATLSATTGTTAADGTVSVTATANGSAGSYAVTAMAAGLPSTASFNLTNTAAVPADFTVAASTTSLTISKTGSATDVLKFSSQGGFNSPVSLTCSGMPAGYGCSLSPATVNFTGGTGSSTLTVSATSTAAVPSRSLWPTGEAVAFAFLMGLWPACRRARQMRRWLVLMMAITVVGTLVGCTSGAGSKTATVTVTAASGTLQHDVSIQVLIK
jgi:uncharacterized repeat protein (TIGR03803 family)